MTDSPVPQEPTLPERIQMLKETLEVKDEVDALRNRVDEILNEVIIAETEPCPARRREWPCDHPNGFKVDGQWLHVVGLSSGADYRFVEEEQ